MKILFLGDVVGIAGCSKLTNNLLSEIKSKNIDFVIVNGENAASQGVGLTKEICKDFFNCGVNVITTGNHVWDQKEIMEYIEKEERLLRPKNLFEPAPGKGFNIYKTNDNIKIGVLNLMGNVFMKKCEDVFQASKKFLNENKLTEDYDILVVDFHGEITSEKNAIGHFFDGKATLVVGTHTHIPTNDARILNNGTGYQTDAGMCGDYDSVIGMNKENSLNRFLKKNLDFLVVDFHGEITSEKMAMGHFFDSKATLVTGTHTHIPTNDARVLKGGTAYITDSGMCGDYDSVIGMNKENSLKRFFKQDSEKHYPSLGDGSLSGVMVDCDETSGLAKNINSIIVGGVLNNSK